MTPVVKTKGGQTIRGFIRSSIAYHRARRPRIHCAALSLLGQGRTTRIYRLYPLSPNQNRSTSDRCRHPPEKKKGGGGRKTKLFLLGAAQGWIVCAHYPSWVMAIYLNLPDLGEIVNLTYTQGLKLYPS